MWKIFCFETCLQKKVPINKSDPFWSPTPQSLLGLTFFITMPIGWLAQLVVLCHCCGKRINPSRSWRSWIFFRKGERNSVLRHVWKMEKKFCFESCLAKKGFQLLKVVCFGSPPPKKKFVWTGVFHYQVY